MAVVLINHKVVPGESLSSIAKKFKLGSWKLLYYAAVNDPLRQRRPNPNHIAPGDIVVIPPSTRDALNKQLQHLQEIRNQLEQSYRKQKQELAASFANVKMWGMGVDAAALLASAIGGIVQIARVARPGYYKTAADLAKANAELLKSLLSAKGGFSWPFQLGAPALQDVIIQIGTSTSPELTGKESLAWAVTRIAVDSFVDATSPSFWAQAWTQKTFAPKKAEVLFAEINADLERNYQQAARQLDARLKQTRALLSTFEEKVLQLMHTA